MQRCMCGTLVLNKEEPTHLIEFGGPTCLRGYLSNTALFVLCEWFRVKGHYNPL